MIRPITIVTFLMACGSGLYLYQSKHEVQLLDRTIEKSVHDTNALREQSRLLSAEWTMLNDPERLRQFSDTYLSLKSIDPKQFTSLNDLDSRLPAPRIETPAPAPDPIETPVALDGSASAVGDAAPGAVAEQEMLPVPPIPLVRPAQVASPAPHPIEAKVALSRPVATPVVNDVKPPEARSAEVRPAEPKPAPRVAEVRPEVRPAVAPPRPIVLAAPRPQPVYAPPVPVSAAAPAPAPVPFRQAMPVVHTAAPVAASAPAPALAPYSGSLLGMARGSMPPAPRPVPVNAMYNAN